MYGLFENPEHEAKPKVAADVAHHVRKAGYKSKSCHCQSSPAAKEPVVHSCQPLQHGGVGVGPQVPVCRAGGLLPASIQQLGACSKPLIPMFAFLKSAEHVAKVCDVLKSLAWLSAIVDCCKPGAGRQTALRQPGGNCTSMIEPPFFAMTSPPRPRRRRGGTVVIQYVAGAEDALSKR